MTYEKLLDLREEAQMWAKLTVGAAIASGGLSELRYGLARMLGAISLLIAIVAGFRAVYAGASYITLKSNESHRTKVQLGIVAAAWVVPLLFFSQTEASIMSIVQRTNLLPVLLVSAFLGACAYGITRSASPKPTIRGFLVALAVVSALCFMSRHGGLHSDEDGDYEADSTPATTTDSERALLLFVLYSASTFLGVGLAVASDD